MFLLAC
jgi:precorrin-2 methylase